MTPEQRARDFLERLGHPRAQELTAGDVVELANLIATKDEEHRHHAMTDNENVLSSPMASELLLKLRDECERQHARAEKAEAEVQDLRDNERKTYANAVELRKYLEQALAEVQSLRTLLVRADSFLSLLWHRYVPLDRKDTTLTFDIEQTIGLLRSATKEK